MSSSSAPASLTTAPATAAPRAGLDRRTAPVAIALVALGLLCFHVQMVALFNVWISSPLRQIGMAVPAISLWLFWRGLEKADWKNGGSWWGLAAMVCAIVLALLDDLAGSDAFQLLLRPGEGFDLIRFRLVPVALLFFFYAGGAVLLLGGVRAWKRAMFPLCLLLLLNPVPNFFDSLVDLPLQTFGARLARGFAHWIDVPVTGDTLRLMFTANLGIFIAPGCDGLRGATTMGFLALIVGHLYRMGWRRHLAFVLAALLLAYIFNLVRLCAVVGYYWVALHFPSLAVDGTLVDYFIGGTLFFCAAWFLFGLPRRAGMAR